LSIDDVERWISSISLSVNDSGIVSFESNYLSGHSMMLEMDLCRLNFCTSIVLWTDKINSFDLKELWVEIFIVMKPEDLTIREYDLELEKVFLNIMSYSLTRP
jgi:hypothetical protein